MLAINKLRKEAAGKHKKNILLVREKCKYARLYTDSGSKPSNANKIISHEVVLAGKLANNTSWSVQKKM